MKKLMKKIFIISITLLGFTSCSSNNNINQRNLFTEVESEIISNATNEDHLESVENQASIEEKSQVINRNINTVVNQPIMNEVTFELSEKLIGRYEVADYPELYFEIKPNGELEITIMTFDGIAEYKNSNELILTAFYQEDTQTTISFSLIGGSETFPGGYLSLDFIGDSDCKYFRRIDEYYKDEKYVKAE